MNISNIIKKEITTENYTFHITDSTYSYENTIIYRKIRIVGNIPDCIEIHINDTIKGNIRFICYDEECKLNFSVDTTQGSLLLFENILKYIHDEIPTVQYISFEDKTYIETDDIVRPIPLHYFSIAFNSLTWYEKHFGARMSAKHDLYREKVDWLLNSQHAKPFFIHFLQISCIQNDKIVSELEPYYNMSNTYGEFFRSIPTDKRCTLVGPWIGMFMRNYLQDVFSNSWVIFMNSFDKCNIGSLDTQKYYCPKGFINRYGLYSNIGSMDH